METFGLPIISTLALWWTSTVAILYLDGLHRRTFAWSMTGATLLLAVALYVLATSADEATPAGAYKAFTCGIVAWGWQLVSYYMGFVTGPRTAACEAGLTGARRFVEAARTSLYHELASLTMAIGLLALTWGEPNQIGFWTFVVLWWMHLSAKLNLFFGVPNLSAELLPAHLQYLASFMARRPMNNFFPVSVTVSTVVTLYLVQGAANGSATSFEIAGYTMLATLMALAVAEHWFLVMPIDVNALWLARSRKPAGAGAAQVEGPGLLSLAAEERISFEGSQVRVSQGDGGRKWVG